MSEFDEFAEALMGQLSVEIDEEKVIEEFAKKINEDRNFTVRFDDIESVSQNLFADLVRRVNEYMGLEVSKELSIEYIKLDEFKRLKGRKVFTENAREFVDKLFDAVAKNDLKEIAELIKRIQQNFWFILLMLNHTSQKYQLHMVTTLIQRFISTDSFWMIIQE